MTFRKLIIDEWRKTYFVLEVTKECFDNSPQIENAGSCVGFKVLSDSDLDFKVSELAKLGFVKEE